MKPALSEFLEEFPSCNGGKAGWSKSARAAALDLEDRLRTAIRTLKAAGIEVNPEIVLRGAGLDQHQYRGNLVPFIEAVAAGLESRPE